MLAQEEARLLSHNFIGTEHVLLGLIAEGEGVAATALESLGISLAAVRSKVEATIGPTGLAPAGSPPFTPRAKKVLELSLREALQLGHDYIGTEHLLLGLLREGEGVAPQVLVSLGADLSRVHQQVIGLIGGFQGTEEASGTQGSSRPEPPPIAGPRSQRGQRARPAGGVPTCLACGASLAEQSVWSTQSIPSADPGGAVRLFTVIYCRACGTVVEVLPDERPSVPHGP